MKFVVDSSQLDEAFSRISKHIPAETPNLFIAAGVGPLAEEGHVVIGMENNMRGHALARIPAEVESPGVVITEKKDQLKGLVASSTIELSFEKDGEVLRVQHGEAKYPIDLRITIFDEDYAAVFGAFQREETSGYREVSQSAEDAKDLLDLASKVAGSSGERAGDLRLSPKGTAFVTKTPEDRHTVSSSQMIAGELFPGALEEDLRWEIESEHLSALKSVLGQEGLQASLLPAKGGLRAMRFQFEKEGVFYERQMTIQNGQDQLKSWGTDEALFSDSRIWATVAREDLVQSLGRLWSIYPETKVAISRDGSGRVHVDCSETEEAEDNIVCEPGPSEIQRYHVEDDFLSYFEAFSEGHRQVQIRSWTDEGEELPNGYIFCPVPEGGGEFTPRKYLIITWLPS